jgi:uncharacterized iron-regulated membrane protein
MVHTGTHGVKTDQATMSVWRRWLEHPEQFWLHQVFFQIHYWMGIGVGMYVIVMSVSGSILVFRNELEQVVPLKWLLDLHENLFFGDQGRFVNGLGAVCLTLLCLTGLVVWWPGIRNWRRGLNVNWSARFARRNWDLHSAFGLWGFLFFLIWGVSGMYLCFPDSFNNGLAVVDPTDRFYDTALFWLSEVHFGRFDWLTKALWSVMGLLLAFLAVTGLLVCCHRMIYKTSANPNRQPG